MECYQCGSEDHLSRNCPGRQPPPPPEPGEERPPWCGICDKRTRLIDRGDVVQRCPSCWAWPARGTYPKQQLAQHATCGGCGQVVYTWDQLPCGKHQPVAHATRRPRPVLLHGPGRQGSAEKDEPEPPF